MKKIIALYLLMATGTWAFGQSNSITITIKNIKDAKGSILVGLYTAEKDFLKNPAYGKAAKANGSEVTVVFDNLPQGEYAVSIIHDENDNQEFDRSRIGIPKEGFCFGNNAHAKFGPPKYSQVKVDLKGRPINQVLAMRYL
jgi:uncharacterized protein (DUF2141 family)